LLNVKALNSSLKNDSVSYGNEKDLMSSTLSNNMLENSHFLSNTQKINNPTTKYSNVAAVNQSITDDGKSLLNSTLNASNYNSNAVVDSRNSQGYNNNNKGSRNAGT